MPKDRDDYDKKKEVDFFLQLINGIPIGTLAEGSELQNAQKNYNIWQHISTSKLVPEKESMDSLLSLLRNPDKQINEEAFAVFTSKVFRNAELLNVHKGAITSLNTKFYYLLKTVPGFINFFNKIKNPNLDSLNIEEEVRTLKKNLLEIEESLEKLKGIPIRLAAAATSTSIDTAHFFLSDYNIRKESYDREMEYYIAHRRGSRGSKPKFIDNTTLEPAYLMVCYIAFIQENATYFEQAIKVLKDKIEEMEKPAPEIIKLNEEGSEASGLPESAILDSKETKIKTAEKTAAPIVSSDKGEIESSSKITIANPKSKTLTLVKSEDFSYLPKPLKTDTADDPKSETKDENDGDDDISESVGDILKTSFNDKATTEEFGVNTEHETILSESYEQAELSKKETNKTTNEHIISDLKIPMKPPEYIDKINSIIKESEDGDKIFIIKQKNYNKDEIAKEDDNSEEVEMESHGRILKSVLLSVISFAISFALCYFAFDLSILFTFGISIPTAGAASIAGYDFLFTNEVEKNFKIKNKNFNNTSDDNTNKTNKQETWVVEKKNQLHLIDMNNSSILNLKNSRENQISF